MPESAGTSLSATKTLSQPSTATLRFDILNIRVRVLEEEDDDILGFGLPGSS